MRKILVLTVIMMFCVVVSSMAEEFNNSTRPTYLKVVKFDQNSSDTSHTTLIAGSSGNVIQLSKIVLKFHNKDADAEILIQKGGPQGTSVGNLANRLGFNVASYDTSGAAPFLYTYEDYYYALSPVTFSAGDSVTIFTRAEDASDTSVSTSMASDIEGVAYVYYRYR